MNSLESKLPVYPGPGTYSPASTMLLQVPTTKFLKDESRFPDEIVSNALYLPGPGKYNPSIPKPRTITLKARGKTLEEIMIAKRKKFPGPGHYQLDDRSTARSTSFGNVRAKSAEEIQLMHASEIPGPGHYNHNFQAPERPRPHSVMGVRLQSLEEMHSKSNTLGPGQYGIPDDGYRPKSVTFSNSTRREWEIELRRACKTPGPSDYKPKSPRIHYGRISSSGGKRCTEAMMELAKEHPGPGAHSPKTPNISGGKWSAANVKRFPEDVMYKNNDIPGPGSYHGDQHEHTHGGRFNMSKPKTQLDFEIARSSAIPGPGLYDVAPKWQVPCIKMVPNNAMTEEEQQRMHAAKIPGPTKYDVPAPPPIAACGVKYIDVATRVVKIDPATDSVPGVGTYDLPSTLNTTGVIMHKPASPRPQENDIPGPGQYRLPSTVLGADVADLPDDDPKRIEVEWDNIMSLLHQSFLNERSKEIDDTVRQWKQRLAPPKSVIAESSPAKMKALAEKRKSVVPCSHSKNNMKIFSIKEAPASTSSSTFLTMLHDDKSNSHSHDEALEAEDIGVDCSTPAALVHSFFPANKGANKISMIAQNKHVRLDIVEKSQDWLKRERPPYRKRKIPFFDSNIIKPPPVSISSDADQAVSSPKARRSSLVPFGGESDLKDIATLDNKQLAILEKRIKGELEEINREREYLAAEIRRLRTFGLKHAETHMPETDFIKANINSAGKRSKEEKQARLLLKSIMEIDKSAETVKRSLQNQMEEVVRAKSLFRSSSDYHAKRHERERQEKMQREEKEAQEVMLIAAALANSFNTFRLAWVAHHGKKLLERRKMNAARKIQYHCMRKFMPDKLMLKHHAAITIVMAARRFLVLRRIKIKRRASNVLLLFLRDFNHLHELMRTVHNFMSRVRFLQNWCRGILNRKRDIFQSWLQVFDRVVSEPAVSFAVSKESETTQKHRDRLARIRNAVQILARSNVDPFDKRFLERVGEPAPDLSQLIPLWLKITLLQQMWRKRRQDHLSQTRDWMQQVEDYERQKRHIQLLLMALPPNSRGIESLPYSVRSSFISRPSNKTPAMNITIADEELGALILSYLQDQCNKYQRGRKSKVATDKESFPRSISDFPTRPSSPSGSSGD